MEPVLYALIAALAIIAVSFSGALFAARSFHAFLEQRLAILVSFSAGVFAVVASALFTEAYEMTGSWTTTLLLALLGGVAILAVTYLIPESHHHHREDECAPPQPKPHALRILIGDAVHNIGDGIILVPAFTIDFTLGIAATIGILIHEVVQEISDFFVLRAAGYTAREALLRNMLAAGGVFVGVAIGALFIETETVTGIILALAGGALTAIIIHDLLPRTLDSRHRLAPHLIAALTGIALMLGIELITPHAHIEEEPVGVVHAENAPMSR